MAIDPPYRIDPFQNIINVHWQPKYRFGISCGMAVAWSGNPAESDYVYAGEIPSPWHLYQIVTIDGVDYLAGEGIDHLHGTVAGWPENQYPNGDPSRSMWLGSGTKDGPGDVTLNGYILSTPLFISNPTAGLGDISFDFTDIQFTVTGWTSGFSPNPGCVVGDKFVPFRTWHLLPPDAPDWLNCGFWMELRKKRT